MSNEARAYYVIGTGCGGLTGLEIAYLIFYEFSWFALTAIPLALLAGVLFLNASFVQRDAEQ